MFSAAAFARKGLSSPPKERPIPAVSQLPRLAVFSYHFLKTPCSSSQARQSAWRKGTLCLPLTFVPLL